MWDQGIWFHENHQPWPTNDNSSVAAAGRRVFVEAVMKSTIRRILNLLLYLSFCAMLGTGLLLAFRLVPGSRGGRGLEVLGWDRHQWGDLHTWLGYAFAILLAAHLVLAWAWLKKVAAKGHLWRLIAGFAAGLAVILGIVLLPVSHKNDGPQRGRSEAAADGGGAIRGEGHHNKGSRELDEIGPAK